MRRAALYLSVVFVFTVPWEDSLAFGGAGSLNKWVGLAAGGSWLVTVVTSGRIRELRLFHGAAIAFFGWALASIVWGGMESGFQQTLVLLALMVALLWDLYRTDEALRMVLQAFVLGAYVSTISLLLNFSAGTDILYERYADLGYFDGRVGRFSAVGTDPNALAIALSAGIVFAAFLAYTGSREARAQRWLNGLFIPLGLIAITLTGSRAGLVAMSIALIYILTLFRRVPTSTKALVLIGLLVAIVGVQEIVPDLTLNRILDTRTDILAGDFGGRELFWSEATELFLEHPLVGVGASQYRANVPSGRPAHSAIFTITAELGIVGLVFAGTAVLSAISLTRTMSGPKRMLWVAQLAILLVGAVTLSWAYVKITWLILSLVVAAGYSDGTPSKRRQSIDTTLRRRGSGARRTA